MIHQLINQLILSTLPLVEDKVLEVAHTSMYSHIAPGCNAALVDVAGQVDQLAVVVLQAVCTEGLVHTLTAQWHGQTLLEGQQAQQKDTQQLDMQNSCIR